MSRLEQIERLHDAEAEARALVSRRGRSQLRLFRLPPMDLRHERQLAWLDEHLIGFRVRLVSQDSGVREDVYIGTGADFIFGGAPTLRFGSPGSCLHVPPGNVLDLLPLELAPNPWAGYE